MLMVILGAGASYDSVPDGIQENSSALDYKPPLAQELFDPGRAVFGQVLSEFHECAYIVPRLRKAVNESRLLEDEMDAINGEDHPLHPQALMALRFYLQRIIADCSDNWLKVSYGVNNYRDLLYQIEAWRPAREKVLLVTFNYDTLLEQAVASMFGGEYSDPRHYAPDDADYLIFKLHGSVNWGQVTQSEYENLRGLPMAHQLIKDAKTLA